MGKFFKAIGKALVYFIVYLILQVMAGAVMGFYFGFVQSFEAAASGIQPDMMEIQAFITQKINESALVITMISGILTLFIYWTSFLIRKKKMSRETQIRKMKPMGIISVLLLGLSGNVVCSFLISAIPFPKNWAESYEGASSFLSGGNNVIGFIAAVLFIPIVEEVVFRGLVYTRLKKGMNRYVAAVLSSALFGAVHGNIIWFIYAFFLGMLLVYVFERYHSLVADILLHIGFNAVGMILSGIEESMGDLFSMILLIACAIVFLAVFLFVAGSSKKAEETVSSLRSV